MQINAKLRVDLRPFMALRPAMDSDTTDLIARLGVRIGMIMEDTSVIALSLTSAPADDMADMQTQLAAAGEDISILALAMHSLHAE